MTEVPTWYDDRDGCFLDHRAGGSENDNDDGDEIRVRYYKGVFMTSKCFVVSINAYTEKYCVEPPISKNIAGQVNGVWKEPPCDTCSFVLRSKLHLRCGDDCGVYDVKTKQTVS